MSKAHGINENHVRAKAHRMGLELRPIGCHGRFILQRHSGRGRVAGGINGWPLEQVAEWLTAVKVSEPDGAA